MTKKGAAIARRGRVTGGRSFDGKREIDGSGEEGSGTFSVSIGVGREDLGSVSKCTTSACP